MSEDTSDGFADQPMPDPKREVEALDARRQELRRQLRALDDKVNTYRVKCPTCRCRILPWEECHCCAERVDDSNDPMV